MLALERNFDTNRLADPHAVSARRAVPRQPRQQDTTRLPALEARRLLREGGNPACLREDVRVVLGLERHLGTNHAPDDLAEQCLSWLLPVRLDAATSNRQHAGHPIFVLPEKIRVHRHKEPDAVTRCAVLRHRHLRHVPPQ